MLRKQVLSAVLAVGATIGLVTVPLSTRAGEPATVQFQVLVREGSGWRDSGVFQLQSDARQAALRLWKDGHRVLIQEVLAGGQK